MRQAISDRMLTILILFDFSKAFDSIPHAPLLARLRAFNMSDHALRWFFSYLVDRLQAVIDGGGSISDSNSKLFSKGTRLTGRGVCETSGYGEACSSLAPGFTILFYLSLSAFSATTSPLLSAAPRGACLPTPRLPCCPLTFVQ